MPSPSSTRHIPKSTTRYYHRYHHNHISIVVHPPSMLVHPCVMHHVMHHNNWCNLPFYSNSSAPIYHASYHTIDIISTFINSLHGTCSVASLLTLRIMCRYPVINQSINIINHAYITSIHPFHPSICAFILYCDCDCVDIVCIALCVAGSA